ncbi:hypothetical protein UFOVP724_23 [uncultured Caudovirales phage]|jgi:hypothetical protein|uniref:Uncharacterized protein n=1 Tax=uncultured Caudovirales phage TaxID=2100421 RepID=A0A6J5NS81_9CAUD|nr:hypothetical protein UFOVP724_23 [uncultured Caudovirales phage]
MLVLLFLLLAKSVFVSIDLVEELISLVRRNRKRKTIKWILFVSVLTAIAELVLMSKGLPFAFVAFLIGMAIL